MFALLCFKGDTENTKKKNIIVIWYNWEELASGQNSWNTNSFVFLGERSGSIVFTAF